MNMIEIPFVGINAWTTLFVYFVVYQPHLHLVKLTDLRPKATKGMFLLWQINVFTLHYCDGGYEPKSIIANEDQIAPIYFIGCIVGARI